MPKFRKKPIVVYAQQFIAERLPWPKGVYATPQYGDLLDPPESWTWAYRIDTPEGSHDVMSGDWIITGDRGERYPCKPDIFEATYDRVAES